MAPVPKETVYFQQKSSDTLSITKLVDRLLFIWCCVDDLKGHVATEVAYLRKERKKDLYEEEGYNDDPMKMMLMFMATRTSGDNEEMSDHERILRGVLKEIKYKPNIGAMNQVSIFLDDLLGDKCNWRGDNTKSWQLSSGHYEDIFRILVWMVREFEEIIKAFFARYPKDTNMLLHLENLRKSYFDEAQELEGLTSEREVFHRMLGTGKYFVSPLLTAFWHNIGHYFDKTVVASNPIDERLTESTRLIKVFSDIQAVISEKTHPKDSSFAASMYRKQLRRRLSSIKGVWESVLGAYFFLGPTETLLKKTKEIFEEIRPLLLEEEKALTIGAKQYRDSIIEYFSKFDSAVDTLLAKLKELSEEKEATPD